MHGDDGRLVRCFGKCPIQPILALRTKTARHLVNADRVATDNPDREVVDRIVQERAVFRHPVHIGKGLPEGCATVVVSGYGVEGRL